jgi:MoaA/NifB/PqqE/SkfB family radical SAM enzyme
LELFTLRQRTNKGKSTRKKGAFEMGLTLLDRVKGTLSARVLEEIARKVEKGDKEELAEVFKLISSLAPARYHREGMEKMSRMAREGHPFIGVFKRAFESLHPNVREKLIANLLVNFIVLGRGIRDRQEKARKIHLPNFLVISPTMRCNLHCRGCYAAEYGKNEELSYQELDRILNEAKDLGMFFFTFTGGECFVREDLLDLWEKHGDCFFQVYTNGTLLDDRVVQRLLRMGNVALMVSIEGDEAATDRRRGPGMHKRVMEVFDRLREAGLLFGFSATCTSENSGELTSDRFLDQMLEKGCLVGWFFQYIPTGLSPDPSLMASPRQRVQLHERVEQWRREKPIFLGDFWNDGPYVDGCMAGGERFFHIISNGDVEPCVFAHFAVDNIHGKSLTEVIESPFFKAIRDAQPYDDDNLLRPCMIIDHPHVLREIVASQHARPTHPGAETILGEMSGQIDRYSVEVKAAFDPVWESAGREKYMKSLESEEKKEVHDRIGRKISGKKPV